MEANSPGYGLEGTLMNLFQILDDCVSRMGERELLQFQDQGGTWTNARLAAEAERLAGLLMKEGVRPRDHVLVLLPNRPELFLSLLALARLGCVTIPVGLGLTSRELSVIAEDGEAEWILSCGELMEKASACRLDGRPRVLDAGGLLASKGRGGPLPQSSGEGGDLAYIIYTSGTQGKPKGVILTHDSVAAEARGVAEAFTVPGEDPADLTQLLVLPLSHSYGLMVMGMTYVMGNRTVVLPRYRTQPVLEAICEHHVRLMWAVPTMYALMLGHPDADAYLGSVVHWDSGGAPLPLEHLHAIEGRFGGTVTDGYGCTEASGCVTTQTRDRYSPPGSQGFLIHGDQMEVVDENGNSLPDGQAGEFLISGATLMKGYWKRPEETDRVFLRGGYLSGDIGIRHPEGYYVFLERKDDLIIRGGENVYPLEIEKQLYQHPDVREAAVKGVPDPVMGCEIKAYVALYEGATPDGASLKEFLSNYLVSYKIPRYIEFRDELPKNSNGKILRRKLP